MYLHWYLNILVEIIVQDYFQDAYCIRHIYNHSDTVHLMIPHFTTKDVDTFHLDPNEACRHFILQCEHAGYAFSKVENIIKYDSDGMYNSRKYLIVITNLKAFENFFNSTFLPFVRNVLIIFNEQKDVDDPNNILVPGDEHIVFKLYTHRYIGLHGNNDPILLDIWHGDNNSFVYQNSLFPDKVTDQMGRELRVSCDNLIPYAVCVADRTPDIGSEQNIILKYANRYNFTLSIHPGRKDFGGIFKNWTSYGLLGGLVRENDYFDIIYGGFRSSPHIDTIRSTVYTYEVSVPIHRIKYGWFWIFKMFNIDVWILLFLAFVIVYMVIHLRRYLFKDDTYPRSQIQTIEIFGLFINQSSFPTQEWKNSSMLKFLSLVLLFSSILYCAAYNSRLSSVMMIPIYDHDVQTLEECSKSDYMLLFFDDYYNLLREDTRKIYKKLYEKIYLIPSYANGSENFELSEKLLSSQKYAVARYRRSTGEYFERYEHLSQMYGRYKPITPMLFIDYYHILLRKNSMHTAILTDLVTSCSETGLMAFWEQDALRYAGNTRLQKMIQDVRVYDAKQNLNMKNLLGCFEFWSIFMGLAIVVFLFEVYFGKKQHFECRFIKNHKHNK